MIQLACVCGGVIEIVVGLLAICGIGGSASLILAYVARARSALGIQEHSHEH